MNNWETCLNPTDPWRSAMSVPREVTLCRIVSIAGGCDDPEAEVVVMHNDAGGQILRSSSDV